MESPLVTVVITTYERPENLMRAIDSVESQTYPNIEIIVVDDNGKGADWQVKTEELLKPLVDEKRIKYIAHDVNRNGSAARNTGLAYSSGEYINFLDDDDEFSVNKIEESVRVLEKDRSVDGVFCSTVFKNGASSVLFDNPPSDNPSADLLLGKLLFNTSTLCFRKSALKSIGGFDESFRRHQDYELVVRFCCKYKLANTVQCHITKHKSENIVTRKPQITVYFLEFFITKFRDLFLAWPNGKEIIAHRYKIVARDMAASGYYKESFYCLRMARKYKNLSFKFTLKCLAHIIRNMFRNNLYNSTSTK